MSALYIRRIAKSRKQPKSHRFDGMSLREAVYEMSPKFGFHPTTDQWIEYMVPRIAREVRRRSAR